ncbi:hypothetical protein [Mesorhizobium sp. 131-2-1]|uniref:hypothetical protein n=1 Tax=Mesorhizobium sp. 131-2-1 TaxID=2744518 RepID=UPI001FD26860|nr:hypothetical protein [Mesorhizobium sp. 131-2-1]
MGTASNEADVAPRLGEPGADIAADAARSYHCDPHAVPSTPAAVIGRAKPEWLPPA